MMSLAQYQREVVSLLASEYKQGTERAVRWMSKWRDFVTLRHGEGKAPSTTAVHILKYERQGVVCPCRTLRDPESFRRHARGCRHSAARVSRDPSNPKPGEVFQTKYGNRWLVTGHAPKGRLRVKRAGNKYEGELIWTPEMFARLKQVQKDEAKAVALALAPELHELKYPSGASLIDRLTGKRMAGEERQSPSGPQLSLFGQDASRPKRRYYVYVIEQLHNGKREFYVGQTGKTPAQRFREHKTGHLAYSKGALMLRKDLYAKVNPLFSRSAAERMEKVIARTLKKRGLRVKGGH